MFIDIFLLAIVLARLSLSQAWNYQHQDEWPLRCQKGISQSPIDLASPNIEPIKYDPFREVNWYRSHESTITNNGHTVMITPSHDYPITISGGGLHGTYILAQYHFHWRAEHRFGSDWIPLEAHFVMYNNAYRSVEEAIDYTNGIAVIGVFYDIHHEDNNSFDEIVQQLKKLKTAGTSRRITFNPSLLLPYDCSEFYRYSGSLTTPDCNEGVVWTVFSYSSTISQAQVNEFASIQSSHGDALTENFRKVQPLNGRHLLVGYTDQRDFKK